METNFAVKGNNNEVIGWVMEDQHEGFGYCCCGDEHEEWGFRSAEKAEDALFEYYYQDCGFEAIVVSENTVGEFKKLLARAPKDCLMTWGGNPEFYINIMNDEQTVSLNEEMVSAPAIRVSYNTISAFKKLIADIAENYRITWGDTSEFYINVLGGEMVVSLDEETTSYNDTAMEKEAVGTKSGICPVCGKQGTFAFRNYEWDGEMLMHYFTCDKCGSACCDYYTVSYDFTNAIVEG